MSNREFPPPKTETAAPVGAGNGGRIGKQASNSKDEFYSTDYLRAIAKTHPIIARHYFGFEEVEMAA